MSISKVSVFFLVLMLFLPVPLSAQSPMSRTPIPSFWVKGVAGESDSAQLFLGRKVVLTLLSDCSRVEPFRAWRDRLPEIQNKMALVLCIGERTKTDDTGEAFLFKAPRTAFEALGLKGTPMILGIEDNRVAWRLPGFVEHWQVLAEQWINGE